jgi:hypothetical protein
MAAVARGAQRQVVRTTFTPHTRLSSEDGQLFKQDGPINDCDSIASTSSQPPTPARANPQTKRIGEYANEHAIHLHNGGDGNTINLIGRTESDGPLCHPEEDSFQLHCSILPRDRAWRAFSYHCVETD